MLLSLFLLSLSAFAAEDARTCGHFDARKDLGPARSQGNLGWCYAHASADLLSYRYGLRVSASDLAGIYIGLDGKIHSGQVNSMLDKALAAGLCEESKFEIRHKVPGSAETAVKEFERVTREVEAASHPLWNEEGVGPVNAAAMVASNGEWHDILWKRRARISAAQFLELAKPQNACLAREGGMMDVKATAPLLNLVDILRVMGEESNLRGPNTKWSALQALRAVACRERRAIVDAPKVVRFDWWAKRKEIDNGEILGLIDRQMDLGNPVIISYHLDQLVHPEIGVGKDSMHASTIVGRRWNGTSCEYLLRNTWGEACRSYKVAADGAITKEAVDTFLFPCEKGHAWVPAEKLASSVQVLDYLENKAARRQPGDPR